MHSGHPIFVFKFLGFLLFIGLVVAGGIAALDAYNQQNDDSYDPLPLPSWQLSPPLAIRAAQAELGGSGGVVAIRVSYSEWVTDRVACSQADVDFDPYWDDPFRAKCLPVGGGGGTQWGLKDSPRLEVFYRDDFVRVPSDADWSADYDDRSDSWRVELEFDFEDVGQTFEWIVDDDTREVSAS